MPDFHLQTEDRRISKATARNTQYMIEGNLEVKLPTIWTIWSREEAERRGRLEERRVEEKE